eukprot:5143138-Pleurochrysis_carterae.AAC.1
MSELILWSRETCTVSTGRDIGSAGKLALGISDSSSGRSENLDLAPTRRSRARPPSSPSRSRDPS